MKTSRDTRDLAEAKDRAERAKRYAQMLQNFAQLDSEFTTVEWQLEQLLRFNTPCAPPK